jgi:hypothetical protein
VTSSLTVRPVDVTAAVVDATDSAVTVDVICDVDDEVDKICTDVLSAGSCDVVEVVDVCVVIVADDVIAAVDGRNVLVDPAEYTRHSSINSSGTRQ